MKCWGSALGGCSETQSHEHIVSRALFESPKVRVQGFSWCRDQPKELSLATLTSKILCTHHNSQLSNIDSAGADAFSAFREATRLQNHRSKYSRRRWTVRTMTVDGPALERWFLKTTINLWSSSRSGLRWTDRSGITIDRPPEDLVRIAFGLSELPSNFGLYAASIVETQFFSDDTVSFAPLVRGETIIVGGLFEFRGHGFILWLDGQPLQPTLARSNITTPRLHGARVHYHLQSIIFRVGGHVSHRIIFEW